MQPTDAIAVVAAPRRREILRIAWEAPRSAGEIHRALDAIHPISFGAISQHLRVLHEAGLMDVRSEGRHRHYSVRKQALAKLVPWLEASWDDALYRLKLAAELERARRGPAPRTNKHDRRTNPRPKGAR